MTSATKLNFRIIENFSHEDKYPDFVTDFRKGLTKKELVEKYEISDSVWLDWRKRIEDEYNIPVNPPKFSKKSSRKKLYLDDWFFRKTYKGNISVCRRTDDRKYHSYGSYPDMDTAVMVKDILLEHDWDKYVAYDLLNKYGVPNSKRCLLSRILRREL